MKQFRIVMEGTASWICYVSADTIETAINLAYETPADDIEIESQGEVKEITIKEID
jgi:hypothetical protein